MRHTRCARCRRNFAQRLKSFENLRRNDFLGAYHPQQRTKKGTDMSHDDHDLGFHHDLPLMLGRRTLLRGIGGIAALTATTGVANAMTCVADAFETAGPYPADGSNTKAGQTVNVLTEEGVIRRDMRTSFGDYSVTAEGLQLDLQLQLVNVNAACAPLQDYAIYAWHCDTEGRYSLYDDTDRNYLRAVGISDASGLVDFTTILPGCYSSRYPHIHFEVFSSIDEAVSGRQALLTGQLIVDEDTCAAAYAAHSVYASSARNLPRQSLSRDMVFGDNTDDQIAQQTIAMSGDVTTGLTGSVMIGLAL
jgi:protocatechuate 3,4-dioxygenase beta subunit